MNTKQALTRKISAHDFAILEMVLYLDTHPNDTKALSALKRYRAEREALVAQYERNFGPYIVTSGDVKNDNRWAWVDNPWPWENEANS